MKRLLKISGIALLVLIAAGVMMKEHADRTFFDAYDPALPFNARVTEESEEHGFRLVKFYFDARPDEPVPSLLTLPQETGEPFPVIILLHGMGQDKRFLPEITRPFNESGFAMVCFDQFLRGERWVETSNPFIQLRDFRARAWKTVNDTRRLVDYLQTHPEIDASRIYLVGASYGAITGSTAAALDSRIRATVLIYGAGDVSKMLDAPAVRKEIGALFPVVKPFAVWIMDPFDPLHHIGRIAPRPVYFQNGTHDVLIATPAAEAYQSAAGDPKDIKWYDSDHVGIEEGNTREVLDDALAWLLQQDGRAPAQVAVAHP